MKFVVWNLKVSILCRAFAFCISIMSLQERSVFVSGLPSGTSVHDLEKIFSKAGTLQTSVMREEEGTAFVTMTTQDAAMAAPMKIVQPDLKIQVVSDSQLPELQFR